MRAVITIAAITLMTVACGGVADTAESQPQLGVQESKLLDPSDVLIGNYYRADFGDHTITVAAGGAYTTAPIYDGYCWGGSPIYRNISFSETSGCGRVYTAERYWMCSTLTPPFWAPIRLEFWPVGCMGNTISWFVERDPVSGDTNYAFKKY
ncbi:hypothetical protein JGU66_28085 [Myxococcaceae bacterium JPH2]|nr:hypothetical protein [Myxococcaceae bacterium JPH2]